MVTIQVLHKCSDRHGASPTQLGANQRAGPIHFGKPLRSKKVRWEH